MTLRRTEVSRYRQCHQQQQQQHQIWFYQSGVLVLGYDSDVAREKAVDYVTKIYSASIRNMSGTRPHLQHKELPVEDRCRHCLDPSGAAPISMALTHFVLCRPPVSRAAPLPDKLLKNNMSKKKKVVEVSEALRLCAAPIGSY